MPNQRKQQDNTSELLLLWVIFISALLSPLIYLGFCFYLGDQYRIAADPPIMLRSILYFVVIAIFPLTNLIRHIMLRLNQTMPGDTPAKSRYLVTVAVSLLIAESISLLGVLLYLRGDNTDTLIIYCLLSLLAMVLYRPKQAEYQSIQAALSEQQQE